MKTFKIMQWLTGGDLNLYQNESEPLSLAQSLQQDTRTFALRLTLYSNGKAEVVWDWKD